MPRPDENEFFEEEGEYEEEEVTEEELAEYMSDGDAEEAVARLRAQPPPKADFSTAVVVDNLPKVNKEKLGKLTAVVTKIFGQIGGMTEGGLAMPYDDAKDSTMGFAFVNYVRPEEAKKAIATLDGWAMDKAHQLKVFPYTHLEMLSAVTDEYIPPEQPPFKPRADPSSWLADAGHRDQFVIRYSNPGPGGAMLHETNVLWCEKAAAPSLCYDGSREKGLGQGKSWCELYVMWSPQGTYLATFHLPGIALWGGEQFEKQGRFSHQGVKIVEFSPCETYILTCNFEEDDRAIVVWDVRSGEELRAFPMATSEKGPPSLFKWSFDGKFMARIGKDLISIYELPSMFLLDKKSLKTDGVAAFEWSPKANWLAYWAPEQPNSPARVSLVEIPSRKEIRQKNLVNVSECRLHWQDEGDYLCVKVLRHTKTKKTMYNNFELFRVKEDLVPVEMMEMRDKVIAFAWEPSGDRFAIIHGEPPKQCVTFYTMKGGPSNKELQQLVTLEDRPANRLFWSPVGQYILMAAMGEAAGNGYLEFYDVDAQATLRQREHHRVSYIDWDPSGRYVTTAVVQPVEGTYWKAQMDNGYRLWTFQGDDFFEFSKDHFYQFLWRPRPALLLSAEERRKIVKNLKKYEKRFERADREEERRKVRAAMGTKIRAKLSFRARVDAANGRLRARHAEKVSLQHGYDSEDDRNYVTESKTREVVLSFKEEPC